jgi:hypothetical protein
VPGTQTGTGNLMGWAVLVCLLEGSILWALSPIGVELSALKFKTPDVFWRLFPSAPLLLALGVSGLIFEREAGRGLWTRIWLLTTLAGLVLVLGGAAGLFHLGLDDVFIISAPAYRAFRAGLVILAAGALLFSVAGTREGSLPVWGGLPFALSSLAGLLAVLQDLGSFGAALWSVFGAGWVWLGLALLVEAIRSYARTAGRTNPPGVL